jgi:hypothetical protein
MFRLFCKPIVSFAWRIKRDFHSKPGIAMVSFLFYIERGQKKNAFTDINDCNRGGIFFPLFVERGLSVKFIACGHREDIGEKTENCRNLEKIQA